MATNIHCSAQFSIIINKIDIAHSALYFAGPFIDGNRACKSLNTRLYTNLLKSAAKRL